MGHEYSYVVVKLEFCNSGPYCGCDCGCGPACGRVETHEAQILGRYTTHSSPYTTGSTCGVGAVDDEYSYPPYQAIPAIEIPRCYSSVYNFTSTRVGKKTPSRLHFNPGTLPHNAVRCVASIHDLILWTRDPISWVVTRVDNWALTTLTTTLALAGGTTGRSSSKHLQPQSSQGGTTHRRGKTSATIRLQYIAYAWLL